MQLLAQILAQALADVRPIGGEVDGILIEIGAVIAPCTGPALGAALSRQPRAHASAPVSTDRTIKICKAFISAPGRANPAIFYRVSAPPAGHNNHPPDAMRNRAVVIRSML